LTVVLEKAALRRKMLALRSALTAEERARKSAAATRRLLDLLPSLPEGPVACFRSIGDELDTAPLIEALASLGRPILLPRVVGRGKPLALHLWAPGEPLVAARFGLFEPSALSPVIDPTLVVTPLLAIDEHGHRVGYGGGFYDLTLAGLAARGAPFTTVGIAFDLQQVERVPVDDTDVPLDILVTDARMTRFSRIGPKGD
jgi:5-formyltetrahydrofolate cyclo-ligase